MLQRNIHNQGAQAPSWWEELGHGAPTIAGFARLCSAAMQQPDTRSDDQLRFELIPESRVILGLAAERGTFEIRSNRDSFDSAERLLAVCVEVQQDQWRLLLEKSNPEQTLRFLEGFRLLCQCGLVMHHLHREFSLSARGFAVSRLVSREDHKSLFDFGVELDA